MGRSKTPPQTSAAFSEHSCNAKEFRNDHLPECGQQTLGSECVLLIGGQVVRTTLRTLVHENSAETLEVFSRQDLQQGTFIGDCLYSHEAA